MWAPGGGYGAPVRWQRDTGDKLSNATLHQGCWSLEAEEPGSEQMQPHLRMQEFEVAPFLMHAPTGGSEGLEDRTSHVLAFAEARSLSSRPPTASPGARLPPAGPPLHLPERMGTESGPPRAEQLGLSHSLCPCPTRLSGSPCPRGRCPQAPAGICRPDWENPCCEHSQPANIPGKCSPGKAEGRGCPVPWPGHAHPIRDLQPLRQAHSLPGPLGRTLCNPM